MAEHLDRPGREWTDEDIEKAWQENNAPASYGEVPDDQYDAALAETDKLREGHLVEDPPYFYYEGDPEE